MPQFRLKHPVSIHLDFSSARVNKQRLLELLQTLHPEDAEAFPDMGLVENWTVAKKDDETLTVISPFMPAATETMDHISAAIALLNFENFSQEFSSPFSSGDAFHLNLGVDDLTMEEVMEFVKTSWLIEPAIKTLLPGSRYNQPNAILLRRGFREHAPASPQDRKLLVSNQFAVDIRWVTLMGSISIRYFGGTANNNKVLFWIVLWASILDRCLLEGKPEAGIETMENLVNWLRWPEGEEGPLSMARGFFLHRAQSLREQRTRRNSGAPAQGE